MITYTSQSIINCPLLIVNCQLSIVPHRLNRTNAHRLPGREIPGKDSGYHDKQGRGKSNAQVYGRIQEHRPALSGILPYSGGLHSAINQLRQSDTEQHTYIAEHSRNQYRFRNNLCRVRS